MAAPTLPDPFKVARPRVGPPVQNMGGFAQNTAPLRQRPMPQPAVMTGKPGPAPLSPSPNPGGLPATGGFMGGQPAQTGGLTTTAGLPPGARNFAPGEPGPGEPGPVGKGGVSGGNASTATVPGAPTPTAPAPTAPAPAPAPAPANAGNRGDGGSIEQMQQQLYGRSGGTGAESGSLEAGLRDYINNAMGGVTSKAFIDRSKNQLGSAVEGQRQQSLRRLDDDMIRRGLFKSGMGAELASGVDQAASGALSSGIMDILNKAEQQDIAGRESAAGTAGNLLGMNRSWDQYTQQRIDAERARQRANAPRTFQYMDPDTGQVYEMDESWF